MFKENKQLILTCVFFVCYTVVTFAFYYERTLHADINNHILSSDLFGIPSELKAKGLKPLYHHPDTGWDGQFYYYMSNDVFAKKDTPSHIDVPSYRYQRIGLSLYVAMVSKILGMSWVSPLLYFVSYFVLILAATWFGARLYMKLNAPPWWILLWSLGVGTQITLFNALPDAAADAFLILGLSALFARHIGFAVIAFTFAALSREVYVLFPSFIFLFYWIDELVSWYHQGPSKPKSYYLYLIPGVAAVLWRQYVIHHFGVTPSSQAIGILGFPGRAWYDYWKSGILGHHLFVGKGFLAYSEVFSLSFFAGTIVLAISVSGLILVKRYRFVSYSIRGIALAMLSISALYVCFGPVVMMHYTGYMKALGLYFFMLPFLWIQGKFRKGTLQMVVIFLLMGLFATTYYNMRVRLLPIQHLDRYTKMSTVQSTDSIACFGDYEADVSIKRITVLPNHGWLKVLKGHGDRVIFHVLLQNTGHYAFRSTRAAGSVFMSGQWVDRHGKVVQDGIRSAIPGVLEPGKSVEMDVVTFIPKRSGDYYFKPSPVQEGCAWFHSASPGVSSNLPFAVSE